MSHPTRSTRRLASGLAVAALATIALAACGSSNSSTPPASPPMASSSMGASSSMSSMPSMSGSSSAGMSHNGGSASQAMITIKNYAYMGATTVAPGASVMVMNNDSVAHTVTADQGSAFNVTVPAGGTATFKAPAKAGTYTYHCDYHAEMHGTLKVS
jgi:plastocyanin